MRVRVDSNRRPISTGASSSSASSTAQAQTTTLPTSTSLSVPAPTPGLASTGPTAASSSSTPLPDTIATRDRHYLPQSLLSTSQSALPASPSPPPPSPAPLSSHSLNSASLQASRLSLQPQDLLSSSTPPLASPQSSLVTSSSSLFCTQESSAAGQLSSVFEGPSSSADHARGIRRHFPPSEGTVVSSITPDDVSDHFSTSYPGQPANSLPVPLSCQPQISASSISQMSSCHPTNLLSLRPSSPTTITASGLASSSTSEALQPNDASAPDDERASESGSSSSAATEADNSEDEHPGPAAKRAADIPMRTLRERERDFCEVLAAKGLRIVDMRPDGNCLFRALAHVLWGDNDRHAALRARIMQHLVQERDYFSQFVAEDFARYVRRKSRDGTYGNHLELQAAAELFGRRIEVYSYAGTPSTIVDTWAATSAAATQSTAGPIRLSFHRGCHYNAVVPIHAPPKQSAKLPFYPAPSATASDHEAWRVAADTVADEEEEIERAVIALSLVEATRGDSAAAGSSSSVSMIPSGVLALVNSGYSEEQANEAYRVAGHGGLAEMVRYLSASAPRSRHLNAGSVSRSSMGSASRSSSAHSPTRRGIRHDSSASSGSSGMSSHHG